MASNLKVKARYFNGKKESTESMLRRFKRRCERQGILQSLKEKEFYIPKAEKKRLKKKYARIRVETERRKAEQRFGQVDYDTKPNFE